MCLIVETKPELPLTWAFINQVSKRNDDGWGMMWIENNAVQVFKDHESNTEKILEKYKTVAALSPILHFRMKTHGAVDLANTHPFYCGHGIFLMHNGVIGGQKATEDISDTNAFVRDWLEPILRMSKNPHDFIRSHVFRDTLESKIGWTNRIVLADRGGYVFFNPNAWYTIKEEGTKLVGMRVSNQYAWNEQSFNPKSWGTSTNVVPSATGTVQVLSKNQQKRLAKQRRRQERLCPTTTTGTPQQLHSLGEGWAAGTKDKWGVHRNSDNEIVTVITGNIWATNIGEAYVKMENCYKRTPAADLMVKAWRDKALLKATAQSNTPSGDMVKITNPDTGEVTMYMRTGAGVLIKVDHTQQPLSTIPEHKFFEAGDEENEAPQQDQLVTVDDHYTLYLAGLMVEYAKHRESIDDLEHLCLSDPTEGARVIHQLFQELAAKE